MSALDILLSILTIVVALLSAIISVLLSNYFRDKTQKRADKMNVLCHLMRSRLYGWDYQSLNAVNLIDIIFVDSKKVREQWHIYFDRCKIENPSEVQLKDISDARNKLIEEIANDLGYKDKITWDQIQNVYYPNGIHACIVNQNKYQEEQLKLINYLNRQFEFKDQSDNKNPL